MSLYLVTGGAGFVGSYLVRFLLDKGESVRVIDNFSTGKRENLEEVTSRIELVEGDLNDRQAVVAAVDGADFVFHEAAIPSVPRSVENPMESHEANASATLVLLQEAREAGVRRLVYASSSSVYGANPELPKVESMRTEPLSPYAVAKLAAEHYCLVFHNLYGLETVALRYFNVFGPRQDPNSPYSGVVSRFIDAIVSNTPPIIHGDGEQTRDFTYVDNVARANFGACHEAAAGGGVYNIGCQTRISVNELWNTMAELTGSHLEPKREPARAGDVPHSLADIAAARRDLGFDPYIGIREGLEKTLSFYIPSSASS
ncbi:MAG: SDR family oxidoreductase [Acidobacteriota bacterium]|nr:MAG: SDR family oxidoreductase [Acidobacteriota bacterium]